MEGGHLDVAAVDLGDEDVDEFRHQRVRMNCDLESILQISFGRNLQTKKYKYVNTVLELRF
jgi:hypothetical protein